jgi:hypothetical protein
MVRAALLEQIKTRTEALNSNWRRIAALVNGGGR